MTRKKPPQITYGPPTLRITFAVSKGCWRQAAFGPLAAMEDAEQLRTYMREKYTTYLGATIFRKVFRT